MQGPASRCADGSTDLTHFGANHECNALDKHVFMDEFNVNFETFGSQPPEGFHNFQWRD